MLTIGEFARYAGVSVRMLRHYDALGLLVPARVDPGTGYRHYAAAQLARANRLVALKDLGFTLEQVGSVLDAEVGIEQLTGMLTLRRAQIREQMSADDQRLRAIEARLRMIEKEGTMSELEFVEKPLPAVCLAQLTTEVGSQAEIGEQVGPLFDRLHAVLQAADHPTNGHPVRLVRDDRRRHADRSGLAYHCGPGRGRRGGVATGLRAGPDGAAPRFDGHHR